MREGDDCLDCRARERALLLRQQVDDVKLLEGCKGRHDDCGRNDSSHGGNRYVDALLPETGSVQCRTLVHTAVDALQCAVDRRNHERKRHPQVQNQTGEKGGHILCEILSMSLKSLLQTHLQDSSRNCGAMRK